MWINPLHVSSATAAVESVAATAHPRSPRMRSLFIVTVLLLARVTSVAGDLLDSQRESTLMPRVAMDQSPSRVVLTSGRGAAHAATRAPSKRIALPRS